MRNLKGRERIFESAVFMARPPLELETWGKIRRTTIAGKPTAVCRYRDSDGVTRPIQRQGKTPAEAERNLIKALKKRLAPAGEDLTGNSTVRAAGARCLAEPERDELAVSTRARYRQSMDTLIGKGFGDLRLAEVTVPRVDRFLKRITDENGPGSAKTVRTILQHVFGLAVRHGAMKSNPVRDVGRIVPPRKPVTAPTVADVQAMRWIMWAYDVTPDKRGATRSADLGDLFDLYIGTGARTAEVLALRWDRDVHLDTTPATVDIRGTVVIGDDGKVMVQPHPKTDTSNRTLKLPSFAVEVLRRRREIAYSEWVFPSAAGTLRWPHNLARNWREALAGTPYKGLSPRSLRKAVATLLRDLMGVDIARGQLGHATPAVTRKHYMQPLHDGPDATAALSAWVENSE
ncbi:tyrosine-type recombinase/integrase [Microbacterium sp. NPDC056052]|uniref:tyrosine-type recombinase/integrase n=1 Tax=Microbacterium sp. NPDC056052 TaxID=3345695 RepID=UPI0035E3AAFB